jgi:predicted lipoprotein with Yx(FWY)xxD motif
MTRIRPITLPATAAAVAVVALAVGAFGGVATAAPAATSARTATVKVAHSDLGKILVDSRGRSLYMLSADSASKSTCFGACAQAWPPLRTTGKPTVGKGLKASKVGRIKRSDGKSQVTYNGHPLYRFVNDKKPGDTNGQGIVAFGGRWSALSPAGKKVSAGPSSSSGGSGGGGSY